MDVKKITDSLDDRLFSDKFFKKCYKVYAFWLVFAPIIETFFHIIGLKFIIMFQLMLISTLFGLTKFFEIIFNIKKFSLKNKTIIDLLVVCLLFWFFVSTIVNQEVNISLVFGICYFCCFYLFLNIEEKDFKLLAYLFVCEMIFDTILGFIDLKNEIIPGFSENECTMSFQFLNPNWSSFVLLVAQILSLWFVCSLQKIWQKILLFIGYLVMAAGMFIGGSYAPEMSLFLCETFLLIYFWVKNKKCPFWILSALISTIFISFAVWFVPAFRSVTTANANFFYETLAVIDNRLGTELVKGVSTIFDKLFGWGVIYEVPGSNGWSRSYFIAKSFEAIFASAKSFIFGCGPGFIYSDIRVHNCFLVVWLEFGIVGILLFLSAIVMLLIRFFKVKKSECLVVLIAIFSMLLFDSFFCCIEPYCFPVFVIFSTYFYKKLYSTELKNKQNVLQ